MSREYVPVVSPGSYPIWRPDAGEGHPDTIEGLVAKHGETPYGDRYLLLDDHSDTLWMLPNRAALISGVENSAHPWPWAFRLSYTGTARSKSGQTYHTYDVQAAAAPPTDVELERWERAITQEPTAAAPPSAPDTAEADDELPF